jgi:glycosyltransferase involved in cell wall biosynthesis
MVVTRGDVAPHEIPFWMNAADVLLITSSSEGSPTVVHEAMACALPIVAVKVGDVPTRIQRCHPSAVVAADEDAIGDALVDILQTARRSNGPEVVRSMSQEVLAVQIIEVYRAAVGQI